MIIKSICYSNSNAFENNNDKLLFIVNNNKRLLEYWLFSLLSKNNNSDFGKMNLKKLENIIFIRFVIMNDIINEYE